MPPECDEVIAARRDACNTVGNTSQSGRDFLETYVRYLEGTIYDLPSDQDLETIRATAKRHEESISVLRKHNERLCKDVEAKNEDIRKLTAQSDHTDREFRMWE